MLTKTRMRPPWCLACPHRAERRFQSGPRHRVPHPGRGPAASRSNWTWENSALFFATDPVKDHVAWRYVDGKRKENGLPPVGASGKSGLDPLEAEGLDIRQPQHIPLAAHLGLGIFDFD